MHSLTKEWQRDAAIESYELAIKRLWLVAGALTLVAWVLQAGSKYGMKAWVKEEAEASLRREGSSDESGVD